MTRNYNKPNPRPKLSTTRIDEDEECTLYTLMCIKSVFMLKKFVEKYGDTGRKLLIDVKYKLSNCPLTYLIIRDIVQESSNWDIQTHSIFSPIRTSFTDKRNNTSFILFNHSRGIERAGSSRNREELSKFEKERIKLYYQSECEMFNDNEKVIVAKVLHTYAEMLKNYEDLKRQQQILKHVDKLRGLY